MGSRSHGVKVAKLTSRRKKTKMPRVECLHEKDKEEQSVDPMTTMTMAELERDPEAECKYVL